VDGYLFGDENTELESHQCGRIGLARVEDLDYFHEINKRALFLV